jgi:universal stress protein A
MSKKGVICAIDVNDFDQEVVDLAARFAKQFGVDLELVHVTLFPDPTNAAWPAYLGSPDPLVRNHGRLLKVTTNVPDVTLHYHHLSGNPSKQVLEYCDRTNPSLVVLGTHGRHGLQRVFGSVASNVLRHSVFPVMVLRQRQNSQDFADLKPELIQKPEAIQ